MVVQVGIEVEVEVVVAVGKLAVVVVDVAVGREAMPELEPEQLLVGTSEIELRSSFEVAMEGSWLAPRTFDPQPISWGLDRPSSSRAPWGSPG